MSDTPTIAAKHPAIVELEPGTYWWCACGLSSDQPLCDGSHSTTSITPVQFDVAAKKKVALCLCKHTGNPPHCDGTHTKL